MVPRISGSAAGISAGGGGGGVPSKCSMTHAPRTIGDVAVPLEVTFIRAPVVSNPPYGLSGGNLSLRNAEPCCSGSP